MYYECSEFFLSVEQLVDNIVEIDFYRANTNFPSGNYNENLMCAQYHIYVVVSGPVNIENRFRIICLYVFISRRRWVSANRARRCFFLSSPPNTSTSDFPLNVSAFPLSGACRKSQKTTFGINVPVFIRPGYSFFFLLFFFFLMISPAARDTRVCMHCLKHTRARRIEPPSYKEKTREVVLLRRPR